MGFAIVHISVRPEIGLEAVSGIGDRLSIVISWSLRCDLGDDPMDFQDVVIHFHEMSQYDRTGSKVVIVILASFSTDRASSIHPRFERLQEGIRELFAGLDIDMGESGRVGQVNLVLLPGLQGLFPF